MEPGWNQLRIHKQLRVHKSLLTLSKLGANQPKPCPDHHPEAGPPLKPPAPSSIIRDAVAVAKLLSPNRKEAACEVQTQSSAAKTRARGRRVRFYRNQTADLSFSEFQRVSSEFQPSFSNETQMKLQGFPFCLCNRPPSFIDETREFHLEFHLPYFGRFLGGPHKNMANTKKSNEIKKQVGLLE